ncbi:uncharacterized protein LTR77_009567 [Saxophila tyrrhenica]|uniref:Uncharacterized protein n=1 Tax=Saxophila tyrrhenica TaxID=1690608 RepID=A0AAV9NYZ9_9PEZI|nr:hypothetical protein LTR77_009567 [Saxophila tyrrhenica]
MADTQHPSTSERFIRSAGDVREDPNQRLWAPARWVVQMIQYLIAIIMVTIGEGIKAIFTGESPKKRRNSDARTE